MHKNRIILIAASIIFYSFSVVLADEPAAANIGKNNLKGLLNKIFEPIAKIPQVVSDSVSEDAPDWVKRTNVAIQAGTGQSLKYFFETVQPLFGTHEKGDKTLFTQLRLSEKGGRSTYNTGLGLRKLYNRHMLGVNWFYDYQDLHKHSRNGVGFEVFTDRGLEARLNTYIGISGRRLVWDDQVNEFYEKVANGFDWEFGAPLPYLPFLKVYGGGNWYSFERFINKYGWKARFEYNPIKNSRIDFEVYDDNKMKDRLAYRFEGAITLAFTSFAPRDIIKDIKTSTGAFPKIKLKEKNLERVVRDFDITVIKSTKSKATGLVIEGGKS